MQNQPRSQKQEQIQDDFTGSPYKPFGSSRENVPERKNWGRTKDEGRESGYTRRETPAKRGEETVSGGSTHAR